MAVGVYIADRNHDVFTCSVSSITTNYFATNMSMTCFHKAPTMGEEIKMNVRTAFLLVRQKVCSAIFTIQPLILCCCCCKTALSR